MRYTKGPCKLLNPEQVEFLKANYPTMSRKEITAALNERFGLSLKLSQVVGFTKNHKISSGRTGCFTPGHKSHNAGLAGKGICKPNSGSFQKGLVPHNRVPVGTITIDADGYHKIKVGEPAQWEYVHVRTWAATHGPAPEGHAVVFVDGDRSNCSIENLELVSRGELAVRNKFKVNSLPLELRPIAKTVAKIRLKTGELKRKKSRAA